MGENDIDTTQDFKDLSEDEILQKLDGMSEEEKIAAIFNTSVGKITEEWTYASIAQVNRAQGFGDHLTPQGTPDLITLLGGVFAYFTLFERGVEEIAREELMNQSEDSQTMIQQFDKLTSKLAEVREGLVQASDYMEWGLAFRLMRRELRLNVTEDGRFVPLSEFEEERVEKPRLVKEED